MPVDSTHPEFDAALPAWERVRDVIAGEDAVKAAGIRYLPRLDSQSDDDYAAYKGRATFYNATARTLDALVGLVFRAEMTVKVPEGDDGVGKAMADFVADVDMEGNTLAGYAKNVLGEVVGLGRAGTLVDWGGGMGNNGGRAAAVFYMAEQIINWRMGRVDGRNTLTLLVLKEQANIQPSTSNAQHPTEEDEFEHEVVDQVRVIRLVVRPHNFKPAPGRGLREVHVEVWQYQATDKKGKREWVLVESRRPVRQGRPLPLIPFIFHGPRHSQPAIAKLPLADIIALNFDHYRLDADFKHGLHFTALPTAWVSGFDLKNSLTIGSRTAWMAESKDARAGFLEFTGQGLTTFERAQDRDERLMAVLGTRMLESQKRAYESAEAIALRQTAETSSLGAMAISVGQSLTVLLRWVYWWNSTEETPEAIGADRVLVELNQDFNPKELAGPELVAVVKAWQAGAISRETMMDLLRRGEVLPPGRTNEEEARLAAAGGQRTEAGGQKAGTSNTEP